MLATIANHVRAHGVPNPDLSIADVGEVLMAQPCLSGNWHALAREAGVAPNKFSSLGRRIAAADDILVLESRDQVFNSIVNYSARKNNIYVT